MRRALLWTVAVAAGLFAVFGLWSASTAPTRASVEETSRAVSQSLRCPTCAGESIADSSALLSDAMRQTVEEQVRQGRSPEQIRAWFAERYGDEVLLEPPRDGYGWLLWGVPVALVGAAAAVLLTRGTSTRTRLGAGALALGATAAAGAWLFAPSASPPPPESVQAKPLQAEPLNAEAPEATPGAASQDAASPEAASPQGASAQDTAFAPFAGGASDTSWTDAVAMLRDAVDHAPGDAGLRLALAGALEQTGEDAAAAHEYAAVTRLKPLDPDARYRHAFALIRSGEPETARQVLEDSLKVEPDYAPSLLLLGALLREEEPERADTLLQRFVREAPEHPAAEQVRAYLNGDGDANMLPTGASQ